MEDLLFNQVVAQPLGVLNVPPSYKEEEAQHPSFSATVSTHGHVMDANCTPFYSNLHQDTPHDSRRVYYNYDMVRNPTAVLSLEKHEYVPTVMPNLLLGARKHMVQSVIARAEPSPSAEEENESFKSLLPPLWERDFVRSEQDLTYWRGREAAQKCNRFNLGIKCRIEKCKYSHHCATCTSPHHGAHGCPYNEKRCSQVV
ncbi:MAG: hypothetical protein SGCHY_000831 [Lobulomycetales sp.]